MRHSGLEFSAIIEVQVMKKALGYVLWLFALLALYPVILDGNDAALLMALVFGTLAYVAVGLPWKPRK
ncbi:MAG: hypothetical protein CBC82_08965 [Cellvibrionales bacterium TMED122]|nr:MAG: hypothetical protein CBC82_08965 [Cellvibrionales bacterium TMED122]